jgi:GTPase SAR1 family protein
MKNRGFEALKRSLWAYYEGLRRSPISPSGSSEQERLETALRSLDSDCSLAVVGEVKAGKSTFINALLGEDVLRSHCLQCTNAITSIFYADARFVRVRFGDGHLETAEDDETTVEIDEAAVRLQELSSINPKYAVIPTTLIDAFLLRGVLDPPIDELERAAGLQGLKEYAPLVRDYVAEYRDCSKIPVEIEYGSPALPDLGQVRIVDTPGVNAIGGIQTKTKDYLASADAVILMHKAKPIESQTFLSLYKEVCDLVDHENLFLFLSHASLHSAEELQSILEEARQLFPEVDPERILAVDNLQRIVERQLLHKSVDEVMRDPAKRSVLAPFVIEHGSNKETLLPLLAEISNFVTVEHSVRDFSKKLRVRRFKEVLDLLEDYVSKNYKLERDSAASDHLIPQWKAKLSSHVKRMHRMLKDYKLLGDGVLCFGGRDGVFFVDPWTGKELWRFQTPKTVLTSPFIVDGIVLFGCYDGCFYGVDVTVGREAWRIETGDKSFWNPAVDEGTLYLGSENGSLYAVDIVSGSIKWRYNCGKRVQSTPEIGNGLVFFGVTDGSVLAVDKATGTLRWRFSKKDWRSCSPKTAPLFELD